MSISPEATQYLRQAYSKLTRMERLFMNVLGGLGALTGLAHEQDPVMTFFICKQVHDDLHRIAEAQGVDLAKLRRLHLELADGLIALGALVPEDADGAAAAAASEAITKMTGKQGA